MPQGIFLSANGKQARQLWRACTLSIVVILSACIGFGCVPAKIERARVEFYSDRIPDAVKTLSDSSGVPSKDRLLYLMEKGVVCHDAGLYEKSIDALLNASNIINEQETISASRQTASLVTSEMVTEYGGEYAERLLVHTYLMMDYLLVGSPEDALVEAKQGLEILDEYKDACKHDYFSRALIAHCYEALGEINDAYIEYKKLAKDMSDPASLLPVLYRMAISLGFYDEADMWAKQGGEAVKKHALSSGPELIVFCAQGRAPVKIPKDIVVPPSIRFSFAAYRSLYHSYRNPVIEPLSGPVLKIDTDLNRVLRESLKARAARILAKETARVAAKEAIARKIDDPLAETLVRLAFFFTEVPDTRGWETLPANLTLLRLNLKPGINRFVIRVGSSRRRLPEIRVREDDPRRWYYVSVRF